MICAKMLIIYGIINILDGRGAIYRARTGTAEKAGRRDGGTEGVRYIAPIRGLPERPGHGGKAGTAGGYDAKKS